MTISAQDLDLIKKEVAGVKEFYNGRIDSELPPLKEEVNRVSAQIARIREMWKNGEKQALLGKYGGADRPRVPYGKYQGLDLLDLAYMRSLLNAQIRQPLGLNPRMLEEWQSNLKAAMDSTTAPTAPGPVMNWCRPTRPRPSGWTSTWRPWWLRSSQEWTCPRTPLRFPFSWET